MAAIKRAPLAPSQMEGGLAAGIAGTKALFGQYQASIFGDGKPWRLYHFPDMSIGIGKISPIAAVVGRFRLAQRARTGIYSFGEDSIDFSSKLAIPGEGRAAKAVRLWLRRKA